MTGFVKSIAPLVIAGDDGQDVKPTVVELQGYQPGEAPKVGDVVIYGPSASGHIVRLQAHAPSS